jgi:hypothetical protein
MAAPVYLETMRSLPTTAVFNNRAEYDRWVNLVKHWRNANKGIKAGDLRSLLVERILILHVLLQRLHDKRFFWDGTPTTFQNAGADHEFTMSAEDGERKDREYWKYYPDLHRWQLDLLKLALASNVSLNISGDIGGVQSLFGALDREGKATETDSGEDQERTDN